MSSSKYHLFLVFTISFMSASHDLSTIKHIIQQHTIKVMAIYFPQFHEVEENNKFWGKGFTEWTLINNYKGEIKRPHKSIGQYNMLEKEVREKQRDIAREYGIDAFCYYHYWFKDKKVMYKGIEKILEDNEPDIPFTLCWANEPWTRNWNGSQRNVLLNQEYGDEADWIKHYKYLSQFFKHPNYIKEDNCPLLYIYRFYQLEQHGKLALIDTWKRLAIEDGFNGLKIIAILGGFPVELVQRLDKYLDGYAEHQPTFGKKLYQKELIPNRIGYASLFDTEHFYKLNLNNKRFGKSYSRGLFYGWDNSSRRIGLSYFKFINNNYELFEDFICNLIKRIAEEPNQGTNYILLNSLNEWSEQAPIEPNDQDGYEILNVLKKIFR